MTYSKQFEAFLDVVESSDYVVVDTETTGLHNAEMCSISIIMPDGTTLLNTLVKPSRSIPLDAVRIHGISDARVLEAPTYAEIAEKVRKFLSMRKYVIAYNADYDKRIVQTSANRRNHEFEWCNDLKWACAMENYAEFYGNWSDFHRSYRYQKLITAAERFNISTEGAHGALADCRMTLGVIKKMLWAVRSTEPKEDWPF